MLIGVSTADDWQRSPTCQVSQAEGLRGGWLALGLESEVRPIACMGLMQARKSGNLWLGQRSRYNALHPVWIRCELVHLSKAHTRPPTFNLQSHPCQNFQHPCIIHQSRQIVLFVFRRRHLAAGSATHLSCKLLSQLWNRVADKRHCGPSGYTSRCAAAANYSPGPSSRSECPGSPAKIMPPRRCSNWICEDGSYGQRVGYWPEGLDMIAN